MKKKIVNVNLLAKSIDMKFLKTFITILLFGTLYGSLSVAGEANSGSDNSGGEGGEQEEVQGGDQ